MDMHTCLFDYTIIYIINHLLIHRNLEPLLGNGLFSSIGKEHAYQKKLINPAFKYTKLKG